MRSPLRFLLTAFSLAALVLVSHTQVGTVLREQKINEFSGGFPFALDRLDEFGVSLAGLDDLDGDGVRELAVGAVGDDDGGPDRGAVWILFLRADGTVKKATKISQTSGGFAGTLLDREQFGFRLASFGDLDGDGLSELAVTGYNVPRARVLFLNPGATVRAHTEIFQTDPVFGGATGLDFKEGDLSRVGDLDGDGTADLAWGAPHSDVGAHDAGAVWLVNMNRDGTAKSARRIASGEGGFTGLLDEDDYFGRGIRPLGDVNGDGHVDLGVLDYDGFETVGRLWILFLDANGQVASHRVITGFDLDTGGGHMGDTFEVIQDLDGDGIAEIAVLLNNFRMRGGIGIGFLARDGSLRKRVAIGNGVGGLPLDTNREQFGVSHAWLGDLDGDGAPELAVGDPFDDQSGRDAGSISVLSLDPDAVRNGSGANTLVLTQSSEPALGQLWSLKLNCNGRGGGLAYVEAYDRPLTGLRTRAGELLVDVFGGRRIFRLVTPHAGAPVVFSVLVPNDITLIDRSLYVQGLCTSASGARLSNALDVLIGR